ncbi:MAG: hypothetical protein H7210_11450 [Pyrinomonadaceae bacterium]|nr:hypothetical protein [Phycisphaerales bacterium]
MNASHSNYSNDPGRSIPLPSAMPPELVETSRLMDALGECDRASAPAGLESRLLISLSGVLPISSSRAADDVKEATRQMEALGQTDRAGASATLEDRIFMATRGVLVSSAVKINVQTQVGQRPAASMSFFMRAAAGLLLGGGVIWGYLALKPAQSTLNPWQDPQLAVAKLEKEIDGHMDQLGDVFSLVMIGAVTEPLTLSTEEPIESSDPWFQYDFLEAGDSI